MTEQVLKGMNSYLDDLYKSGMLGDPASFESRRILAERTLNKKDLPETLNVVWSILRDFSATNQQAVLPLANWLVSTLTKCLHAADPLLHGAVDDVVSEMAANTSEWGRLGLRLPPDFLTALREKGLQFSLETADTVISE